MAKIFAVLGVLLILSGALLLAIPRHEPASASRSGAPSIGVQAKEAPAMIAQIRGLAEQANAPLSILFGLMSLYYTRRTYMNSQRKS